MAEKRDKNAHNSLPEIASGLLALHQESLAALSQTVQRALAGTQSIAGQQATLLSQAQRELALSLWRGGATPAAGNGAASAYFELAKRTVDSSLAQSLALAEIALKLQAESFAIFGRALSDGIRLALNEAAARDHSDAGR